jgi:hypothetical protein
MPEPKPEPFTDVTFPREYPRDEVADHEVLMSFNGDDDAFRFREWWDEAGAVAFAAWLANRQAAEE